MSIETCVCGKATAFAECCGRFLSGKQRAKTPEQLMRSRYSAYALGGYGEYLLSTWFPVSARGLSVEELSEKTADWKRLQVMSSSQQGDSGVVEFKAWFSKSVSSDDEEVLHEVSEFLRIRSRWYYVGGRVD